MNVSRTPSNIYSWKLIFVFDSVITSVEKWGYVQVQIIQCQNLKIISCNSR
ncbi:unnamed protein product [Tenebrio molitor]|nr:unnamed protein product [Tenebrio molitor]